MHGFFRGGILVTGRLSEERNDVTEVVRGLEGLLPRRPLSTAGGSRIGGQLVRSCLVTMLVMKLG